jgi:hypothetical protein
MIWKTYVTLRDIHVFSPVGKEVEYVTFTFSLLEGLRKILGIICEDGKLRRKLYELFELGIVSTYNWQSCCGHDMHRECTINYISKIIIDGTLYEKWPVRKAKKIWKVIVKGDSQQILKLRNRENKFLDG